MPYIRKKKECITMSLKEYSKEKMMKMSLIELTKLVLLEEKKPMQFNDIFNKVTELKELSDTQKREKIGQFYTDLNVDGNLVSNGSNQWGLKRWHRPERKEENVIPTPRKFKRARGQKTEEDYELDLELSTIDENIDDVDEDLDFEEDLDIEFDEEYEEDFDEDEQ